MFCFDRQYLQYNSVEINESINNITNELAYYYTKWKYYEKKRSEAFIAKQNELNNELKIIRIKVWRKYIQKKKYYETKYKKLVKEINRHKTQCHSAFDIESTSDAGKLNNILSFYFIKKEYYEKKRSEAFTDKNNESNNELKRVKRERWREFLEEKRYYDTKYKKIINMINQHKIQHHPELEVESDLETEY